MSKGVLLCFFLLLGTTFSFGIEPVGSDCIPGEQQQITKMLGLTNYLRTQRRVQLLTLNQRLCRAAAQHAADLARSNYSGHKPFGGFFLGSNPGKRVALQGYRWDDIAENICIGSADPNSVIGSWMRSSAHYRHLVDSAYNNVGIGITHNAARTYWVLLLARPSTPRWVNGAGIIHGSITSY